MKRDAEDGLHDYGLAYQRKEAQILSQWIASIVDILFVR